MRCFVEHNINEYIKVKLKPKGIDIYKQYFKQYEAFGLSIEPIPLNTDESGWTLFQMWNFMEIFGPHMQIGMTEICETTVQIQILWRNWNEKEFKIIFE